MGADNIIMDRSETGEASQIGLHDNKVLVFPVSMLRQASFIS
jgi:hypothetical protein